MLLEVQFPETPADCASIWRLLEALGWSWGLLKQIRGPE